MKKIFIGITILAIAVSLISAETSQNSSTKNDKETFKKYQQSAEQNDPEGIYNLGILYMKGRGVKKDMKMAYKLFLKSADMGYARAQYNMGVIYMKGLSVKKDYQKSFRWFEMTAKQNVPEAYYVIGWLYEKGKGVKKNTKKSLAYYMGAADLGDKNAIKEIKKNPLLNKDTELVKKGMANIKQGNHKSAIKYFQGSVDFRKKFFGKYLLPVSTIYLRISRTYISMKNYPKALEFAKKSLAIREKLLGKENPVTGESYTLLSVIYVKIKNYSKALENLKPLLTIQENQIGAKPLDTVTYYNITALSYKNLKDYPNALKYYQKSLAIQEKVSGSDKTNIVESCYRLAEIYEKVNDYSNALKYYQKSLTIQSKDLGNENDRDMATVYNNISRLYRKTGDYTKTLEYGKKALTIRKKVLGENHTDTASSYSNIGELYRTTGNYTEALKYFHKALSINKKLFGKEHIKLKNNYQNLGALYANTGVYSKALEYNKKAIAIIKNNLEEDPKVMAMIYNNMSLIYNTIGNNPKALKYAKEALVVRRKILGENHPDLASSYLSLAQHSKNIGNYPKALEYIQKALSLRVKFLGKDHPDTANIYNTLSIFYGSMGDSAIALEYAQKAFKIIKIKFGVNNLRIAPSYILIGGIYLEREDYSRALEYFQKALVINEKFLGKENISTALNYFALAALYHNMKNYSKAIAYTQKALVTEKKIFGEKHFSIAVIYSALGVLSKKRGDYSASLKYYQKALSIRKEISGLKKEASNYGGIGSLYQKMEDYPKAYHYSKQAFDIFLEERNKVFTILDSTQKEKYLKKNIKYIDLLLSSTYSHITQLNKQKNTKEAQRILQLGTNDWLTYKGSIFDSENAIAMLYASTKDKKLKAKIDDLVNSKRYLAKLYQSLPKPKDRDSWKKNIKNIEEKIAKLSNQISSSAASFKEQQGLKSISYKDITSQLKDNELYIDYAKAGGYYYLFTLDHKENIKFVQIDKNSTQEIDRLVKTFREDITTILNDRNLTDEKLNTLTTSSKEKLSELYELVINKPLGNTIKNKTSLIISPDGALRLLPFETLFNKEKGKYFIEEKEIRYIPSGKELVRLYKYSKGKVSKKTKRVVIFANPNFDTKIASASKEQTAITPNTNRSGIIKSLFRMRFTPLPGTKAEAKAIKATLDQKSISEYQDNKATESALMKINEPNILHIATHGFFINDNTIPNPMLKSGIALAGANASAIKGKSDGIVTALKLSGLDLKGTDLVVLSACQTGVVDINATDSVSGLSKAFIQAGAKDIVMSLWSVDDQATKELMTSFYQEMKANKNYAEALKAAKLKMIEEGRHPFYWGAFVLSGL